MNPLRFALTAAAFIGLALVSACSQEVVVTFNSVPSGARMYMDMNGRLEDMGSCPVTLVWEITSSAEKIGYVQVPPVTYKWVSGASTRSGGPIRVQFDNCNFDWNAPIGTICRAHRSFTLDRPGDAPNKELDIVYGLGSDSNRQLKRQAEAQERQAETQKWIFYQNLAKPYRE